LQNQKYKLDFFLSKKNRFIKYIPKWTFGKPINRRKKKTTKNCPWTQKTKNPKNYKNRNKLYNPARALHSGWLMDPEKKLLFFFWKSDDVKYGCSFLGTKMPPWSGAKNIAGFGVIKIEKEKNVCYLADIIVFGENISYEEKIIS